MTRVLTDSHHRLFSALEWLIELSLPLEFTIYCNTIQVNEVVGIIVTSRLHGSSSHTLRRCHEPERSSISSRFWNFPLWEYVACAKALVFPLRRLILDYFPDSSLSVLWWGCITIIHRLYFITGLLRRCYLWQQRWIDLSWLMCDWYLCWRDSWLWSLLIWQSIQ